jgi:uncharacterized protein YbjT (DUF2867 family)
LIISLSNKTYTLTGPDAISYGDASGNLPESIGRNTSYVSIFEDE